MQVALLANCDPRGRIAQVLGRLGVKVRTIRGEPTRAAVRACDALFVYGGPRLSGEIFEAPPLGAWNFHPSLLPRRRGAEPERRVLFLGDRVGGVTVHRITDPLDCGPILMRRRFRVDPAETIESYRRKALTAIESLLPRVVREIADRPQLRAQRRGACERFTWDEARVRFGWPVWRVVRRVRYARPPLYAHAYAAGRLLLFGEARPATGGAGHVPGRVLRIVRGRVYVRCADGVVALRLLHPEAACWMRASEVARIVQPGSCLV